MHANEKKLARINVISDMLSRLRYVSKAEALVKPDTCVVMVYDGDNPKTNGLAI